MLDLDLSCATGGSAEIDRLEGELVLADARLLGIRTGDPSACLETASLAGGGAYLEQEPLGDGRVRWRATVVRPQHADARVYRLGIHVIEARHEKLFGVWSLDFAPGARVRRGTLEVDLRDRSARAEIDAQAAPAGTCCSTRMLARFSANAVWWQLNPIEQLKVESTLSFDRSADGTVVVTRAMATPRFQALSAP